MIGTLVWDRIWHPTNEGGRPLEQWGGIAYSLSGFAAACPPGWSIVPILRIGSDLADPAFRFLASLPKLAGDSAIRVVPEPNNRVELLYGDAAERTERLTGGVTGWSRTELEPILDSLDAIYVNFISGLEMNVDTAELFRQATIPVYADLHSLFLGPPGDAPRVSRRLPEWRRWLRCFDAVQLNEAELGLLGEPRSDTLGLLPELPVFGPALAVVTRGGDEAAYALRADADDPFSWPRSRGVTGVGEVQTGAVPPPNGRLAGDPTGCGDVWGSVFFAGLCGGVSVPAAMQRAHLAAAAKMGTRTMGELVGTVAERLE